MDNTAIWLFAYRDLPVADTRIGASSHMDDLWRRHLFWEKTKNISCSHSNILALSLHRSSILIYICGVIPICFNILIFEHFTKQFFHSNMKQSLSPHRFCRSSKRWAFILDWFIQRIQLKHGSNEAQLEIFSQFDDIEIWHSSKYSVNMMI